MSLKDKAMKTVKIEGTNVAAATLGVGTAFLMGGVPQNLFQA